MRILIATGEFPPAIGSQAYYSGNLSAEFKKMGHAVQVVKYGPEKKLPSPFRHFIFFLRVLAKAPDAEFIVSMDAVSVGLPSLLAARIFKKKHIVRLGGDFLWESYVERASDGILLSKFYDFQDRWNSKERMLFRIVAYVLKNSTVVCNSSWFREIISRSYALDATRVKTVENFYGEKLGGNPPAGKVFIWATRPIYLKNGERLASAIEMAKEDDPEIILDSSITSHRDLLERIKNSYAVIVPSISDVNPNLIYDSIRCDKPFIVTKETGLPAAIKSLGIEVDPLSVEDIYRGIRVLLDEKNYRAYQEKIMNYKSARSWNDVAVDFIKIMNGIS